MGLGNPYLFRASYSDGQIDYPIADWVTKHAPGKRAVTVAVDFAPGYVFVGKFEEIFSGEGRQVIRQLWVPIGTQDFAPYLSQIDPDTEVIYAFLFSNDADRFLRGVHDFGLNSKLVAGLSLAITPQTLGEKALGIVTATAYSDTMDSPLNREFVAAYRKAYKADPTEYSGIGYTETQLVLAAIRNIKGEVTRQSITDALAKVELPDSIRGPLKFDSRRNIVTNIYIARVEKINGGFHNVIIDTYQNVSQFWNLSPEEYMAKKPYARK
jgi:branched-chain amino acid transport system substrate-binding protein